jgi:hypothetical protein
MPEGVLPSQVNNSIRQLAADLKTTFNEHPWYDIGYTPTRTGNSSFTVPIDATAIFSKGRRIKCGDATTILATVVSSSFGAGVTTVTTKNDSGSLSSSLTTVHYSIEGDTNVSAEASFSRREYATTAGTSTAYTADYTPKLVALDNGAHGRIKIHTASGATPTLAIDGLTAKTMVKPGNVAIASGDLAANAVLGWTYDSTLDRVVVEGLATTTPGFASSLITADPNPAVRDTLYGANTAGGVFTVTMPASPGNGDKFYFDDAGGTWHTSALTIDPNGNTINGVSGNMVVNDQYASFGLVFWTALGYRIF